MESSGASAGFDQVESDAALKARFRSLYVRAALMKAQGRRDNMVLVIGSVLVSLGWVTALIAIVAADFAIAVAVSVTALCVLFVLHRLLVAVLQVAAGGHRSVVFTCAALVAGSTGLAIWLAQHSLGYAQPFTAMPRVVDYRAAFDAGMVVGLLGLPAWMASVVLASILGSSIVGRNRMRSHPDVIVFGAFVDMLGYLGSGPAKLASLPARGRAAKSLERAALAVEYGLRHALRLPDSGNDLALRQKLYAMASVIRSHQLSLVLSEKAAFPELSSLSVRAIRSVCFGTLGSLPVAPSPAVPARQWRSRLTPLRDLAVALAPTAVVLVLGWREVLPTGAAGPTIVGAAAGWTVVSLLLTLDPPAAGRLRATGDLVLALRGGAGNRW